MPSMPWRGARRGKNTSVLLSGSTKLSPFADQSACLAAILRGCWSAVPSAPASCLLFFVVR